MSNKIQTRITSFLGLILWFSFNSQAVKLTLRVYGLHIERKTRPNLLINFDFTNSLNRPVDLVFRIWLLLLLLQSFICSDPTSIFQFGIWYSFPVFQYSKRIVLSYFIKVFLYMKNYAYKCLLTQWTSAFVCCDLYLNRFNGQHVDSILPFSYSCFYSWVLT